MGAGPGTEDPRRLACVWEALGGFGLLVTLWQSEMCYMG